MKNTTRKPLITRLRDLVAGDGGFTLLETLAVMVIVGLLAAITVPQISKWREKAYVASIKTDARNVANAIEADYTDNAIYTPVATGTPPTNKVNAVGPAENGLGVKLNAGNTVSAYALTTDGTAFSFRVTTSKAGNKYVEYNSATGGLGQVVTP